MKKGDRHFPIYPRLNRENHQWLKKITRGLGVSEAQYIDELISYSRELGVRRNKKLFGESQAA